jgi:hypothetical protein
LSFFTLLGREYSIRRRADGGGRINLKRPTMPYIRRDNSNAKPNAKAVYADSETEKILLENGFAKASGAPYYNRGFVDVVVYDDGTWEPNQGTGFLREEWQKMREFAGVQLKDFAIWLKEHHQFIEQYCAGLNPDNYRKEETFTFVKVHKSQQEDAWLIQHFSLLGTDGVIPCDEKAVPNHYWYINGKYYESMTAFTSGSSPNQIYLNETPYLEREMTDAYVIKRIEAAFLKDKNH